MTEKRLRKGLDPRFYEPIGMLAEPEPVNDNYYGDNFEENVRERLRREESIDRYADSIAEQLRRNGDHSAADCVVQLADSCEMLAAERDKFEDERDELRVAADILGKIVGQRYGVAALLSFRYANLFNADEVAYLKSIEAAAAAPTNGTEAP
jgi:hypothetical protein